MALFKLNGQVKIGPTFPATIDITDYIISIQRNYSICNVSQAFTLEVEPRLWKNLVDAMVQLNPGTCVEIYEYGVKVLTGFFSRIVRARKPEEIDVLEGQDKYKLAMDFFNENESETAHGETVEFLSEMFLARCGLTFILDNAKIGAKTVPLGTEFGFRTIHECLTTLSAYAAGYYYVDSGGNVRLTKGRAPGVSPVTIVGGQVSNQYFDTPSDFYTLSTGNGSIFGGQVSYDDTLTRNRAIVWGWYGPDAVLASGQSTFIKADAISDLISLPVTRTVLYASTAIQDQNTANHLADDILKQLANITRITSWDVQGSPDFRVGQLIHHNFLSSGPPLYDELATTVNSIMDKDGYVAQLRVGERCPRFAGWTSESAINKSVWIAGSAGGSSDPVPQKLIWTGDLSGLGEPTFNLVTGIPSGTIMGMEVCRDNSAIFLYVRNDSTERGILYWADAQKVMDGNGTWTEICRMSSNTETTGTYTGTDLGSGWVIDGPFFHNNAIYSMQCVGKTLYLGLRAVNGSGTRRHFYAEWKDGVFTHYGPVLTNADIGSTASKNAILDRVDSNTTRFYNPKTATELFRFDEFAGFNGTSVTNGIHPVNAGILGGGIWVNELNDGNYCFIHSNVNAALHPNLDKNGSSLLVNQQYLSPVLMVRGDYYGSQIQVINQHGDTGNTGDLQISTDGSSFATTLTWHGGICICIDDSNPKSMYWISDNVPNNNEIGRFILDGGSSFVTDIGTGNWWGTNSEVLAGSKIQAGGTWNLVNIHPTFDVSLT